jgi:cytochrome b6-f complex iron-sulfur subunit
MNLNRRKLLSWFGLGWLASLLPSSLVGCSDAATNTATNTATTPQATTPTAGSESVAAAPAGAFKSFGKVAQLDKGEPIISGKIAVVRDPQNQAAVLAVSTVCTHNRCDVKWQKSATAFVCPCHDAKFAANGAVLAGPANTPLTKYATKIENGEVFVKV